MSGFLTYSILQSRAKKPFVIQIDTTKGGSPSDTINLPSVGQNMIIEWGDGTISTNVNNSQTNVITHQYTQEGVYDISIRNIEKIYFNNIGDKLKLLKTLQWGDYGVGVIDHSRSFMGCENHTEIASDGKFWDIVENGDRMFFDNRIEVLPENMTLSNLKIAGFFLFRNPIEFLPQNIDLEKVEDGNAMLRQTNLTDLPSQVKFKSLTNGTEIFRGVTLNTARYSQLLIDLEAENPNDNVVFAGGGSKYNTNGETARNALISRGWSISDGGLE